MRWRSAIFFDKVLMDKRSWIIRFHRLLAGTAADIDLLVGSNTKEIRPFFVVDGSIDRISEEALKGIVAAYGLSEGLPDIAGAA
jgi:hypothetical protein